jgi:hypothetical protein
MTCRFLEFAGGRRVCVNRISMESTSKGSEYISIANCKVSGVEPLEKIG